MLSRSNIAVKGLIILSKDTNMANIDGSFFILFIFFLSLTFIICIFWIRILNGIIINLPIISKLLYRGFS